jgi:Uma2 family endonuclease
MFTQTQSFLTPQEYLAIERKAEFKSEYCDGRMLAMAGARYRHNAVAANSIRQFGNGLEGSNCRVLTSDMRVCTNPNGLFTYPDVVVVCGEPSFLDDEFDTLLNPILLVEVLSPSTQHYDRIAKFELYRSIPSLRDYVLIAQDRTHIELYSQQPDGRWLLWETNDINAIMAVPSLGIEIPVRAIYA